MEKDLGRLRRGVDAAVDRVGLQIAARLQQLEKLADAPGGQIAHEPVGRQILQPELAHAGRAAAAQHLAQKCRAHAVAQPGAHAHDAREDHLCLARQILQIVFRLAVAAVFAARRVRLAEIIEQIPAQTAGGLAVAGHLLEADEVLRLHSLPLLVGQLVVFRLVEDQVFGRRDVAGGKEQDAVGGSAVAPGAAGLLIIRLYALGHVAVDDVGDVRFVDAHAEGVRGDHDGAAVADEILLILPPLLRAEPGVVARGGEAAALQQLADLLDALARGAVDDAALVAALFEQLEQRPALVLRPQDLKAQVRPVKAGDDRHRVLQLQDADDIAAHLRRRRGGEGGQGGPPRQFLQEVENFQVARAEILPPLGDAVRLVDREQ